ncbi:MAG: hypothetical protein PHO48_00780 [Candidatus Gracilibacteria bacterium]|nr:hypothetical protein [Candidatus Gracilibacteria bacterium]MDD5179279.1 hypothetical protein [Candidatus Gracilibacteria bacterium]
MAFSRHRLSIGKPADIQSFLTQRFSGRRRHRAARPQQTAKHLEKWRFVKKTKVEATPPPTEKITRDTEMEARIKTFEEEVISLQTKISTTETKLQEKDVRIQQLETEKLKLEEANASLEKTNQALKMQLSAVESISQAQGKIIENLREKKSEKKDETKNPVEKSTEANQESLAEANVETPRRGVSTPEGIPTESAEETPKVIPAEEAVVKSEEKAATETPTAAEVFSEIPDERNPEKEKQTEVEAAEISQTTGNETPTAKEVKSEETPTISEATKAAENKTETTETEAGENSTKEKAVSDSPAVETENAETNQKNVETPHWGVSTIAEVAAEEKVEIETPAEARSETVESPAEVAQ